MLAVQFLLPRGGYGDVDQQLRNRARVRRGFEAVLVFRNILCNGDGVLPYRAERISEMLDSLVLHRSS